MFRPMRRIKQLLPESEAVAILQQAKNGVLAVNGDDGYPYAVPVDYHYEDGKIYIHGSKAGHKIDAIKASNKVSFSVVTKDDIIQENFTTYFQSAICFGKASIVTDNDEFLHALDMLCKKTCRDLSDETIAARIEEEAGKGVDASPCAIIRIDIEHMTAKEAIELIREREK